MLTNKQIIFRLKNIPDWSRLFGWMTVGITPCIEYRRCPYYADVIVDIYGVIYISGSKMRKLRYSGVGDFYYFPTSYASKIINNSWVKKCESERE